MRKLSALALIFVTAVMFTACSEPAGSGEQVSIPAVVVDCKTSHCRTNSNPYIYVYITQSSCDPSLAEWSTVASSVQKTCDGTSGCYWMASGWTPKRGASSTKLPAGTYTVCGRIDYNNNYIMQTYNDDTTIAVENVTIGTSTPAVSLTNWQDP